jgi:hypothetical protein
MRKQVTTAVQQVLRALTLFLEIRLPIAIHLDSTATHKRN